MKNVLNLVQTTLDTLLAEDGVRSFWGRRTEIDEDPKATEYIIYELNRDTAEVSADGDLLYRMTVVSLQYYVKYGKARTYQGRCDAMDRMDSILSAMRKAGFGCPSGWFEIGDVDSVGFATFRSEYEIPRAMEND